MTVRLASCSCGQLRAEVLGEPISVSVCHCYACQRRTGSAFGAQANFPRDSVAIRATARSSFGWETKAEDSRSPSARNAGRRSSTSRKVTNNTSPSLLGPLRTHAFRLRRSLSTRSAGIPGSPFPTMSRCTSVTRSGPDPLGEEREVGRGRRRWTRCRRANSTRRGPCCPRDPRGRCWSASTSATLSASTLARIIMTLTGVPPHQIGLVSSVNPMTRRKGGM
jgi:hypothetical protein